MKLLSDVQDMISKDINNIFYDKKLKFTNYKSSLSSKIGIDYWSMIDPPPTNDSRTTTNDLTEVIRLANNRISKEIELVFLVDKDPIKLFLPFLKNHNIEFPYQLFNNLYAILDAIILDIKYFYNRPRPEQLAEFYNIKLDIIHTKTHPTPSYPSGHTAYSSLAACLLSDMYPKYSDYYWGLSELCGTARVLQGVHFPSDNIASIKLVKKVYKPLVGFIHKYYHNRS